MAQLSGDWQEALQGEFRKEYYAKLYRAVVAEYRTVTVYPPPDEMFNAFHFTPLSETKVVILGQDPYHGPGQANGLCFSVKPGIQTPPSLVNIYKELHDDLGCYVPNNGCLEKNPLGKTGRAAFEYGSDRACASGKFPSWPGLGGVYGCRDTDSECSGPADRLPALGQPG